MHIHTVRLSESCFIATTRGLKKVRNEDTIDGIILGGRLRLSLADGHWGSGAAAYTVQQWLHPSHVFPQDRKTAIAMTRRIEDTLFARYGGQAMDAEKDRTPETSFIACEINRDVISIIGYGDCRLLIVRDGQIAFSLQAKSTWLGAFSKLGLRNRLPVQNALQWQREMLRKDDVILLFSDGIDQCVYEKDTISFESLALMTKKKTIDEICNDIFAAVFSHGAEDNASLAVVQV